MKKLSLVLCVLLVAGIAQAQNAKFGIKGGLNVSTLTDDDDELGSRLGFNGGLLAHVHLSPQLALQPEIVYSSQGAKYTLTSGEEHSLALNYVNIPMQVQYMFDNGFRIQTGPQVGFLAGVKDKVG